jgi:hypothetical protein
VAMIYDVARIVRSKNAGPFTVTIDIIFDNRECWRRAVERLDRETVARAYRVTPDMVLGIIPYEPVLAVKINLKRRIPSGSPGDRDVYGAQQHVPIGMVDLECGES